MKKIGLILPLLLILAITGCKSSGDKSKEGDKSQQAKADSLQDEVVEGHNVGMAKTSLLVRAQKETERLIDSIEKLPAKARKAAEPYKDRLNSLKKDLEKAHNDMEEWMSHVNLDSAKDNLEQRIKYLGQEKIKINKVKEGILESLQKADSVIKSKF